MASCSKNRCFIDMLPNELLVHIFLIGSEEQDVAHVEDRRIIKSPKPQKCIYDEDTEDSSALVGKGKGKLEVVDLKESDENDDEWSDEEDEDDGEGGEDGIPFQTLVSHICQRWREVVIGIPTLWTKLRFTEDSNIEQAQTCLARSKDAPLDINIDLSEEEEEVTSRIVGEERPGIEVMVKHMEEIMDILIPHVQRWGQLFVESTSFEAIHRMLLLITDSKECTTTGAPMLQLLHIGFADDMEISDFEESPFIPEKLRQGLKPFRGNLPSLKELSLWEVHLDWSIFAPPKDELNAKQHAITNLTALELRYHTGDVRPTIEQFKTCLSSSPNLESLILFGSAPHPLPEASETQWYSEKIKMNSLVSLTLGLLPPRTAVALLKMMITPAIQKLAVDFSGDDYTDAILQLAAEFDDTSADAVEEVSGNTTASKWSIASKLTYLKLGGLTCSESAIQRLYTQLKNVETLDLNMNYVPEIAGMFLVQNDPSAPPSARVKLYCPKLRTFFVSGVSSHEVCQLVKMRAQDDVPLQEVMLNVKVHVHADDLQFLQKNLARVEFVEYSSEESGDEDDDEDDDDDGGYEDFEISDASEDEDDESEGEEGDIANNENEDDEWVNED